MGLARMGVYLIRIFSSFYVSFLSVADRVWCLLRGWRVFLEPLLSCFWAYLVLQGCHSLLQRRVFITILLRIIKVSFILYHVQDIRFDWNMLLLLLLDCNKPLFTHIQLFLLFVMPPCHFSGSPYLRGIDPLLHAHVRIYLTAMRYMLRIWFNVCICIETLLLPHRSLIVSFLM
jgi:hypothetical protein